MYSFTTNVKVADEFPKFFFEVGHHDNTGMFHLHIVSPAIYDSFGAADDAAQKQVRDVRAALRLRARRDALVSTFPRIRVQGGAA